MPREVKWVLYFVLVIVAAFFGMALSGYVMRTASTGGAMLFTLAMLAMVVAIFVWLLSGNRKVRLGDAAATEAALAMQPAAGKAALYILRKGFVGMLQGFDFTVEGPGALRLSGQAKGNHFLHAELPPGTYRIAARGKGNGGETQVTLAAGEVAVLRVVLEPGMLKGAIVFDALQPASARADLASVKLALWSA